MAITYNPYNWEIREREETVEDIVNKRRNIIKRLYDVSELENDPLLIHSILEELFDVEEEYIKLCYDQDLLTLDQVLSMKELSR